MILSGIEIFVVIIFPEYFFAGYRVWQYFNVENEIV